MTGTVSSISGMYQLGKRFVSSKTGQSWVNKAKQGVDAIKSASANQPIAVNKTTNKNMNYQSQHNITVNTDGSVLAAEVGRITEEKFRRLQAEQEAYYRRALHDTAMA